MDSPQPFSFHFFGNLWLENPADCLNPDDLANLLRLMPLVQDLERRHAENDSWKGVSSGPEQNKWHLTKAFNTFVKQETEAWARLGVSRPSQFLIPPSGSLEASIACHLCDPTFHVADPFTPIMDDSSNPSIYQVHQAGFSSADCFFLDHIHRREETLNCLRFYTDDILQIHEDFTFELRNHMKAVVEICLGVNVRKRVKGRLRLVPLCLWGSFKGVTIFLEIDDQGEYEYLVRFVIFVSHPQFFFLATINTERGRAWRSHYGRDQDISLTVAARLGGLKIQEQFYEKIHNPGAYGRLKAKQRAVKERLKTEAIAQLEAAFPGMSMKVERRRRRPTTVGMMKLENLENVPEINLMVKPSSCTEAPPEGKDTDSHRLSEIEQIRKSFDKIFDSILPEQAIILSLDGQHLTSMEDSDFAQITEWEYLPEPLIEWIQNQDGLKIDGKPISNNHDLVTAYHFLQRNDPDNLSVLQIAVTVATTYIREISLLKYRSIRELIILGVESQRIMPRKCRKCERKVLDDCFAYYVRKKPQVYVTKQLHFGCGLPGCLEQSTILAPIDGSRKYATSNRIHLESNPTSDQGQGEWTKFIVRSEDECKNLPKTVKVQCQSCQRKENDNRVRWTIESKARYLIPRRNCPSCNKLTYWKPTVDSIITVHPSGIAKTWRRMQDAGCDLNKCPRLGDLFFSNIRRVEKIRKFQKARKRIIM